MHLKWNKKWLDISWNIPALEGRLQEGSRSLSSLMWKSRCALPCSPSHNRKKKNKKRRRRKKPKSKNKVKSISDSVFSEWLIHTERESELTARGSGVDDFSHKERLTERVGKIEVQRWDEMRGGAVSGGVRLGGRILLSDAAVYLSQIMLKWWLHLYGLFICSGYLQADMIRAWCSGRGTGGRVEHCGSWHTCMCLHAVCLCLSVKD